LCVARVEERKDACMVLVGRPVRKRPPGRPRHRWEKILEWIFRKWDGEAWTGLMCLRIGTGLGLL